MTHDVSLIATIAAAFGLALVLGFGAVRAGYLVSVERNPVLLSAIEAQAWLRRIAGANDAPGNTRTDHAP